LFLLPSIAHGILLTLWVLCSSANPCAIVSSRLSAYLKRPGWSALAPCPLAKELETVHPRRTYFFLANTPRQSIPAPQLPQVIRQRSFISPSLSSDTSRSDEADAEARRALSPSPEVDLSSPEFDDMDDEACTPSASVGSLSIHIHRERKARGASPPLEKDEREFTQTANGLQKRKIGADITMVDAGESMMSVDERDDALFGESRSLAVNMTTVTIVSPAIRPALFSAGLRKEADSDNWVKLGGMLDWDQTPENIELDELDCLLDF
jgi:hypothetical protein